MDLTPYTPKYSLGLLILIAVCSIVIIEGKIGKVYWSYFISLMALGLNIQSHLSLVKFYEFRKSKKESIKKLKKAIDQIIIISTWTIACLSVFVLFCKNMSDIILVIYAYNIYNFLTVIYLSYLGFGLITNLEY